MSSQILIWKDKCQKWDDIDICHPLIFSPAIGSQRIYQKRQKRHPLAITINQLRRLVKGPFVSTLELSDRTCNYGKMLKHFVLSLYIVSGQPNKPNSMYKHCTCRGVLRKEWHKDRTPNLLDRKFLNDSQNRNLK